MNIFFVEIQGQKSLNFQTPVKKIAPMGGMGGFTLAYNRYRTFKKCMIDPS